MSCIYYESAEVKARVVTENSLAWSFLTNIPIVPGHILVLPKRCVRTYEELSSDEKEAIEKMRVRICHSLREVFGAEGFNFAWNDGEIAGQSIPHFHLHIVPRKKGDEGTYEYEPRKFLYRPGSREKTPENELKKIAELISSVFNQ